ncbi:MAG: family 10 glycosylhydrolase [Victivallales bacterium]|nr:family 10 glycosylhydrolase [Victivallales bacterium]
MRLTMLCLMLSLLASAQGVLVVQGSASDTKAQNELANFADKVKRRLTDVGVEYKSAKDNALTAKSFEGISLAFFPYNKQILPESLKAVEEFVAKGGKLAVFYNSSPRLLNLVGVKKTTYLDSKALGDVQSIAFDQKQIGGLPQSMVQMSRNVLDPELMDGTKALGHWADTEGKELPRIAVTLNDNGIYFTHVYLDNDAPAGKLFFLSLVGHYLPDVWEKAVRKELERVYAIGGMKTKEQFVEHVRKAANAEANPLLSQAGKLVDEARHALNMRNYPEAYDKLLVARKINGEAYLLACPSRTGELRGAWIHSAYGLRGKTWDETIKVLAENGFNAIFANMSWSYVADYQSEVLPVHPDVATRGDQIEECLKACRKYGVELHVWHVCWNMGHRTPEALVKQMQEAERTQLTYDGTKSRYLAPHIRENFDLERDAFLEIVKKYPVDGIHFDYIRYPGSNSDYSPSAQKAFENNVGSKMENWPGDCREGGKYYKQFIQWRQDNISRLVEVVSKEAHRIRKDIRVSAAVFSDWGSSKVSIGQDAAKWIENGWLDFVCPMDYTTEVSSLENYIQAQMDAVKYRIPYYPGVGSYLLDSPVEIAEQLLLTRRLGGDGFVCFCLDNNFATRDLPALKRGIASVPTGTLLPHHSSHVEFAFSGIRKDYGGNLLQNDSLTVEVVLPPGGRFTQNTVIQLERNGVLEERIPVKSRISNKGVTCQMRLEYPGRYRLLVTDQKNHLLARSPVLTVFGEEEKQDYLKHNGPPQFAMNGDLRVALWDDGAYGAKYILEAIKGDKSFDATVIYKLTAENLRNVQVLIIPQPRRHQSLFKDEAMAKLLADYVKRGGGLLTTHALVGIREFVNAVPQVVQEPIPEAISTSFWKVSGRHPIVKGLPIEQQKSTFGDMVGMKLAKGAVPLLVTEKGTCVMAAGSLGRGRYVPCGLGLAIGPKDRDCPMTDIEKVLLKNTIHWLGKKS